MEIYMILTKTSLSKLPDVNKYVGMLNYFKPKSGNMVTMSKYEPVRINTLRPYVKTSVKLNDLKEYSTGYNSGNWVMMLTEIKDKFNKLFVKEATFSVTGDDKITRKTIQKAILDKDGNVFNEVACHISKRPKSKVKSR